MAKSRYLVGFPAQKKEPKWFQNLGRFKKNSSTQWPKKSPKNWTGPCLTLNMVRRNKFSKWQTPARNAKSSFEAANPMPLPNSAAATGCQNDDGIETYSRPPPLRDNVPHGLFSAHSAKTCFICTQPQNAFFLAKLALKGNRANGKSRYLVGFPAQKKEPKWFQNLGRFKKNSSTQWPKKSPKNWTGPCLTLNMVRRNKFSKWQTPARNAKSSFEAANPMPLPNSAAATGCQNDDGIETYCGGP